MTFKRARSKEQKDIRITEISDAAAKLFDQMEYDEITLAAIADELSFTRANLYKYIKTKEEIFLNIILEDFSALIDELELTFNGKSRISNEEFAVVWAAVVYKHKRFIELFSILNTTIEKKSTPEKLADFKTSVFELLINLITFIKSLFPTFHDDKVKSFVYMQLYFIMGLYPATNQSETQKKAVELAGVPYIAPDFVKEYSSFILLFINEHIPK